MKLNSYLAFSGNCEAAINFYKDVFDGEITILSRFSEMPPGTFPVPQGAENLIMHATLNLQGNTLMASDTIEADKFVRGNDYHVSVNIASEDEASAVFNSLAEGGQVEMPFESVFWGGRFGMLVDQFGVRWMVSSEHKPA